ncbi:MAG: dTDP-4-dehydrorhamnose reductase [Clostridiales bacterium]|nr:dTDP-4-dehydrorhamnose reductase [Clostridiales bacterium]
MLVTGVNGQLGHDAVKLLKSKGVECRGVDIGDFDLTDSAAVSAYVKNYAPTVIVHCAAYTAVDKAEDDAERCFAVNVTGTQNIAAAAKESGAALMYISTDYVYGGGGKKPFAESDAVSPLSVYGVTKKKGEDAVTETLSEYFILRTSWVFGKNGGNFVKTMLRLAKEKPELNVVTDQIGSPTYTADLSRLIAEMIFTRRYGVYNASNEGYCSWKEFADEIFKLANVRVKVNGVKSGEYAAKARRPLNSRLDKTKLEQNGFARLPDWRDALKRYLKEIE